MNEILKICKLEKYYGSKGSIVKAIDDISFSVSKGEFIGVMGPSGSGKTTLLNMIATIDEVTSGNIYLGDKDLTDISPKDIAKFRRENLGFIFQDFNLLDTLTIHENIALALTINKTKKSEIDKKVLNVAKELGIEELLSKYPYEVSGGQKQRTACARALITNPKLILADEPTGALDSRSAQMLIEMISNMNKDLGATILMVTHDSFTASYCSRILFIKDGRIFTELTRGENTRRQFFNQILDVVALLGGDVRDVR
ncbi:ABC transporter [[Clostridium] sordellii]|uniref:ABC transporter ATP-binding protein n=1 Tax=Paraclostridium sordellii TaxID=1505 RepID=UPI0002DF16B4|nr:ABC transporter ATP-binding protein [Paeniclostridium sordellii]MCR1848155.1 ABC transporter ATP-binding protein [Paeniclostridium sordellii]CEK29794.1 ABC transporter [[Clostridium] sordellii] [Paeniclostridium sordellii]CEN81573.1 ABC transporter [[Clostridium] sordellii] [Paeniclostridium sordellii]CEQ19926.1 ABC transporter [[Clostridium] sordellii] [Paeniclostridium sordellii]CEQ20663.1 ABC transporter [[Clostridium] sordellii] [Paeniclostridium sordellii]